MEVEAVGGALAVFAADEIQGAAIGGQRKRSSALDPSWTSHVVGVLAEAARGTARQIAAPKLRVPALVGCVQERATVGREARLGHGCVEVAGDLFGAAQLGQAAAAARHLPQHQAGAVPGHLRMVPFDPREAVAAGMPRWLHVKVGSLDEALWPTTPCRIDYGEAVAVLVVVDID